MQRITPTLLAAACLAFAATLHAADLKLNPYFADHMVLQRDRPLAVWGTAQPAAQLKVTLTSQTVETTADAQGRWTVQLAPLKAGGPHTLKVSAGATTASASDILVGDVWLCAGQSNMQMSLKETVGGPEEAKLASAHPNLRLCTVPKHAAGSPESSTDIKWKANSPDAANNFSAVGYYFAVELLKSPAYADVPIGLIDSSFGGTMAEGWTPKEDLAGFDSKEIYDSMFGIKASHLYNAMIAPLGPTALKGVVWYQGEGNSGHPENYTRKLTTLIAAWRRQFGAPELPFIIVSLPDYVPKWGDHYWSWFREVQAQAAKDARATGVALAINTTDGTDLHPKEKREIGRRVALLARELAYHEPGHVGHGPAFKSATPDGRALRITLDAAGRGLQTADGRPPRGFMVAGDDGKYRYADAKIEGDAITLTSEAVPAPKTARYAWAGVPDSNVVNKDNLPLAPFRTDDFARASLEVQAQSPTRRLETPAYEITLDKNGKVTSLCVAGKQFLSTDAGNGSGSSIPGFFGPRSLSNFRQIGPDLLSYGDNDVTLILDLQPTTMTWRLNNRGKDDLSFRIALGPTVTAAGTSTLTITRGKVSFTLQGADKVTGAPDEKVIELSLKKNSQRELTFKLTPP